MSEILTYSGAGETPAPLGKPTHKDMAVRHMEAQGLSIPGYTVEPTEYPTIGELLYENSNLRAAINDALESAEAEGIDTHRGTDEKREFWKILTEALEAGTDSKS